MTKKALKNAIINTVLSYTPKCFCEHVYTYDEIKSWTGKNNFLINKPEYVFIGKEHAHCKQNYKNSLKPHCTKCGNIISSSNTTGLCTKCKKIEDSYKICKFCRRKIYSI